MRMKPICHIVAGPNGAGKSTFALDYLPEFAGSIEYVNPDLMAQGLSPTDITLSSLKAGKQTLIYTRHDRANPYSPKMAARMRKDLGI